MRKNNDFLINGETLEKYLGTQTFPILPDGITEIADKAFENKPISGVRFPYGLIKIGADAFHNCERLKTVVLPETLREIGDGAFSFCQALTEIHIPASVEKIGYGVFAYCERLEKATFDGGITELVDLFDNCPITRLDIPDGVINLDGLCHYCKSLKSVRLPDSLQNIGYKSFYGCKELADINLPRDLNDVGDSAFYGCVALSPSAVESIKAYNPKAFDMSEEDLQSVEEQFEADGDEYESDGTPLGDMRALAASLRDVEATEKRGEERTETAKTEPAEKKREKVYLPVERQSVSEKADLSTLIPKSERVYIIDKANRKKGILKAVFTPFFVFALIWAVIDFGAVIAIIVAAIGAKNPASLLILLFFAVHLTPVWIYIGVTSKAIKNISAAQCAVTEKRVWHKSGGSLALVNLSDIKKCETESKGKGKDAVVLKLNGGQRYKIEELENPQEISDRIRRLVERGDF